MAVTASKYNQTLKKLMNQEVNISDLYVMLLDSTATFDASNTNLDDVAGAVSGGHRPKELYGNGWAEGGTLLTGVAITIVDTSKAMLDADDVSVDAVGGPIPPTKSYKAVIYDATDSSVYFWIDFGDDEQAGEDTPFKFVWNANGILRVG